MQIVLGGKFEAALTRALEETNRPDRLPTSHSYYLSLHRWTERAFFERLGTFVAVANTIEIGGADWLGGQEKDDKLRAEDLGLRQGVFAEMEDRPPADFGEEFLKANLLSPDLLEYISSYHPADLPPGDTQRNAREPAALRREQAEQYLRRITEQVAVARHGKKILLVDERDLRIISAISDFIKATPGLHFPFPDLTLTAIDGMSFGGGILNFAPQDALSLRAVRADKEVRRYAEQVRKFVVGATNEIERERSLLAAMREARTKAGTLRQVESVIETSSLVAAPITYLPVVGNVVSMVSDAASLGGVAAGRAAKAAEWYLLAVRASTVSIHDYLARKGNL